MRLSRCAVPLFASLSALALALACSDKSAPSSQRDASVASGSAGQTAAEQRAGQAGMPSAAPPAGAETAATVAAHGGAGSAGGTAGMAGRKATAEPDIDAAVPATDAGSKPDAGPSAAMSCERCSAYATPQKTGSVEPSELEALSGVAASRKQPGIIFAHNDHDRPVVFALDLQGKLHARINLQGATATDIEDIAVGVCGAQTCVYLADIGDNAAQRDEYAILRFMEPEVPDAPGTSALSPSFERYRFTYEDGSHNAESLMVAPNGALYILTKLAPGSGGSVNATGPSSVYKLDPSSLSTSQVARATKLTSLSIPKSGEAALSAAAAHPCGAGFLVRTYDRVYEFLLPAGSTDFESAFMATPSVIAMPDEPQSEGIDYQSNGRGFISSGEGPHAPIYRTDCAP
jgi:hypothetical protein